MADLESIDSKTQELQALYREIMAEIPELAIKFLDASDEDERQVLLDRAARLQAFLAIHHIMVDELWRRGHEEPYKGGESEPSPK